jgi:hypothetical protein
MPRALNLTDAQLAHVLQKPNYHLVGDARPATANGAGLPAGIRAMSQPVPPEAQDAQAARYRSKTEARYAEVLRWRQAAGEIEQFWYEPFSLRLGASSFYWPDFLVQRPGTLLLELVEVKGTYIRSRAMDKPKAAASKFLCFVFTLAQWDRQTWTETRIAGHL